jgi:hypothetical protein
MHGADGNLVPEDLYNAAWVFQKRSIPASRLQAPGAHEDAAFDHYGPDAYDAMRLAASPYAEDFIVVDGGQNIVRETSPGFHARISYIATTVSCADFTFT